MPTSRAKSTISASAMRNNTAIIIYNDLTTGNTCVRLRATNNKLTCFINKEFCFLIH